MPETKTIIILANSERLRQRCVAGREVVRTGPIWTAGPWVRFSDPTTGEGEVPWARTAYQGGGHAEVLDIAEVDFDRSARDPDHPEDWLLSGGSAWRKVGSLSFSDLPRMTDRPPELWSDRSSLRSVRAGFVRQMPRPFTIVLLESPPKCEARWWREQVPDADNPGASLIKTRQRLSLFFAGRRHEFDITDPKFQVRHRLRATALMDRPTTVALKPPFFVCLSLTKPFRGNHYKIAAAIIEPNA
jgi:hypothetical protein